MLPESGAPREATMEPQNNNKLSHVKAAPDQRSCGDCRGLVAHEALAQQREHDGRAEDDDQSADAVQQAAHEPFWIRRKNTPAEIGESDDKQASPRSQRFQVLYQSLALLLRPDRAKPLPDRRRRATSTSQSGPTGIR